jgi:hypothetical protein
MCGQCDCSPKRIAARFSRGEQLPRTLARLEQPAALEQHADCRRGDERRRVSGRRLVDEHQCGRFVDSSLPDQDAGKRRLRHRLLAAAGHAGYQHGSAERLRCSEMGRISSRRRLPDSRAPRQHLAAACFGVAGRLVEDALGIRRAAALQQ